MFFSRIQLRLCIVFACIMFGFFWAAAPVQAVNLSTASIRLDRTKASTAPGSILVQLKTGESVTENGVQVTVGSAWSISSSASAFTISTSGLPTGTTALPGVATATSVAGQVITFPASNLNAGTTYGFYITGGITSNPSAGSGSNYVWSIATLVASSVSSQSETGVSINANDQINVSATVGATTSDFSATLSTTTSTTISPGSVVDFTITYSSTYVDSTAMTLQASWNLGTLSGGNTPTVSVFEYVSGSASDAYGSTSPVIDTVARTITWNISSIPSNTLNQTVTFQLRALSTDTGTTLVTVPVTARITDPVTTADSTKTITYQFTTTTPTPTPGPASSSSSSSVSATSTPAPGDKKICNSTCSTDTECASNFCYLSEQRCREIRNPTNVSCQLSNATGGFPTPFESIEVTQVSQTTAEILVNLNISSSMTLKYGLLPSALNSTQLSSSQHTSHLLTLTSLLQNTDYFFQVETIDHDDQIQSSDIYHFKTARSPFEIDLSQMKVLVTSEGLLISDQQIHDGVQHVILPTYNPYELTIFLSHEQALQNISLSNTAQRDSMSPPESFISLLESQPNVFVGKHITSTQTSEQSIMLHLEDFNGNIRQFPLLLLHVVEPLRISDQKTHQPIEQARLLLYWFDQQTKTYIKMPSPSVLKKNPLHSTSLGIFSLALPPGKYRGEFLAMGHQGKTVDFEIGWPDHMVYPQVELAQSRWDLLTNMKYYIQTLMSHISNLQAFILELSASRTIFELMSALSLATLVSISFISLAARLGVPIWKIPQTILQKISHFRFQAQLWSMKGRVTNADHQPVRHANITILDSHKKIIAQVFADRHGVFRLMLKPDAVNILVTAAGYLPLEQTQTKNNDSNIDVVLEKSLSTQRWLMREFSGLMKESFESVFELLLVGSVVAEIIFLSHFGIGVVAPYLALSSLNAAIWLIHLFHLRMFHL